MGISKREERERPTTRFSTFFARREKEGKHRHGGERGSPGQAAAGGLGQGFRQVGQERPLPLGVELQVLSSEAKGALGEEDGQMEMDDGYGLEVGRNFFPSTSERGVSAVALSPLPSAWREAASGE